jgi:hypothetical protein
MISIPKEYLSYMEAGGTIEGELTKDPLWFILWPPENIEQYNRECEMPIYAPSFLGFGTNGANEILAFDSRGEIYTLPAIGLSDNDAIKVASDWREFTTLMKKVEQHDPAKDSEWNSSS